MIASGFLSQLFVFESVGLSSPPHTHDSLSLFPYRPILQAADEEERKTEKNCQNPVCKCKHDFLLNINV